MTKKTAKATYFERIWPKKVGPFRSHISSKITLVFIVSNLPQPMNPVQIGKVRIEVRRIVFRAPAPLYLGEKSGFR